MYKILKCYHCGQLQVTAACRSFGCKYCGRQCVLDGAVVLHSCVSPDEALEVVQELKAREG